MGVDPNRNFAFNYMLNGGASSVKCHNYYAGPQPFSEPETRALNDFYATVHAQVDVYLAFHSFANMLLYPYGHTLEPAQTAAALRDIGQAAVDALEMVYGNLYELGTPPEILCKIFFLRFNFFVVS